MEISLMKVNETLIAKSMPDNAQVGS